MSERHSYGTSLGCVSRRIFIMLVCLVGSFVCIARLAAWFFHLHMFDELMGKEYVPTHACQGLECYEVFSCRGFAWTTDHIREPFTTVVGAIMFPLGVLACLHGYRDMLKLVATYLMALCVLFGACLIGDVIYLETCYDYPANMIEMALLWPIPFPIRAGMQEQLSRMQYFPQATVDKITHGFATLWMYLGIQLAIVLVFIYVAREARKLGMLFERGPIGLGVHYGLGQFDEILNHDAIKKLKEPKSFFVEDGQLPLYKPMDSTAPLGYLVGNDYGAFEEEEAPIAAKAKKMADPWEERSRFVDDEVDAAREEYDKAEKKLAEAQEKLRTEKETESKMEEKAEEKFRHHEEHKEQHEEAHAEEEAEEKAREAREEAHEKGKSHQEVAVAGMKAYQKTIAKHHRNMIEKAQERTIHEHYRHSEREKQYHEMEAEISQQVVEAQNNAKMARAKLSAAKSAKRNFDSEKMRLVQSGQWKTAGEHKETNDHELEAAAGEEKEPGDEEAPRELPYRPPYSSMMATGPAAPPMWASQPTMIVSGPPPVPMPSMSAAAFGPVRSTLLP